jgi:flagellar biosynthesis protein FlhA
MRAGTLFQPTILFAIALMAIIVMMILPVPSFVVDIGLAASFGLAILIFTVTLFIERPLDFSSFPTVLLASLMLRLSLNVSSTKLIIGEGHTGTAAAGGVIEGFAMFVMGGSVVMGLVIFCVLLIVNFIVINKGAARMAEVGARFALDGMPGKQLAIDSDMAAGAIDHAEAKARREREQAETTFFGSLDGASKFVKGDAIAGLLITLLNLVVGLIIGTTIHDMPLGRAFETYSILTVGDGLVSQIPAVIIAIASALLLARGGATGATDTALLSQLGRHPSALATGPCCWRSSRSFRACHSSPSCSGPRRSGSPPSCAVDNCARRRRASRTPSMRRRSAPNRWAISWISTISTWNSLPISWAWRSIPGQGSTHASATCATISRGPSAFSCRRCGSPTAPI